MIHLIDTHTHFDVPEYAAERAIYAERAFISGVRHLLLIGTLAKHFDQMTLVRDELTNHQCTPQAHLAFGLHPLFIKEQRHQDLETLESYIKNHQPIAIGEIGLDTYPDELKNDINLIAKQEVFFVEQVKLAKAYDLPILLHIRKRHTDVMRVLRRYDYKADELGGIAHSFSGGEQEALAFAKMGFKLGITGQITNPNAKKLRRAVMAVFKKYGVSAFVIETDCPDMMPMNCQHLGRLNEPANLIHVLDELSCLFDMDKEVLARKLWQNSNEALCQSWNYDE
ncbi:TatD family hydrolase [Moraxella nasibovis]|uniref:TatD family hydrolase n=1 Tax=Moraxella nasibovis TaxID=2904120 RepID=UPI00240EC702|nr:TatD family hydrolase [Moraxella nasibovis]WFF38292.1 TatD family hydrolase [Moraxella nasibovis]